MDDIAAHLVQVIVVLVQWQHLGDAVAEIHDCFQRLGFAAGTQQPEQQDCGRQNDGGEEEVRLPAQALSACGRFRLLADAHAA